MAAAAPPLPVRAVAWLKRRPALRRLGVASAFWTHAFGFRLAAAARRRADPVTFDRRSLGMHRIVRSQVRRQRREYEHYAYFHGYPYQAWWSMGLFGERDTEARFDEYGLGAALGAGDRILDIGCNCGYFGIIAAHRTGARAVGLDINPHMVAIGQEVAQRLGLGGLVSLRAQRFQEFQDPEPFTAVLSFATHWTDDGNYRVDLMDHLERIHALLAPGGRLFFESHTDERATRPGYADVLAQAKGRLFEWDGHRPTDEGRREFYVMRRL